MDTLTLDGESQLSGPESAPTEGDVEALMAEWIEVLENLPQLETNPQLLPVNMKINNQPTDDRSFRRVTAP